ncbi:MAG: T9SS type A sorting domain-containing protein [Crocinitomicaceae bacterium]|nr:T9SS type A sorting domain-containing protein [Crocinitomicaceae bacterium]
MRLFNVITILQLSVISYGQVPDYFVNDPKWVCGLWDSDQWGPPPAIPTTSTYVYYLNGDTIIGTETFHRIFWRGETYAGGPNPTNTWDSHSGTYLRQDGKSIRFYNTQIGVDSLLVSYDYQVGDTVKGDIFQECGYSQDTIQKIDSILINSEYRKVFYLDSIAGPVITEGVGHQVDLNSQTGEFIKPLCQGIGFDYYIHCFGFGDVPYWDSQGTNGNCYLNVSIEELDDLNFLLYPNPASDYLLVKIDLDYESISVISLDGKVCLTGNSTILELQNLKAGSYIVEVKLSSGGVARKKVILE